ncbi:unnamed protein product [Cuscuta epithymum]|uniref:Uncharacterized protein n=1 Tax=Cuscuta epithymum TaxID=186058 RepID=A0AAV0DUK2_9ASTE|nr:unnamed protein product [Cuscuta epithymum]
MLWSVVSIKEGIYISNQMIMKYQKNDIPTSILLIYLFIHHCKQNSQTHFFVSFCCFCFFLFLLLFFNCFFLLYRVSFCCIMLLLVYHLQLCIFVVYFYL